jgi:hypothetical protein
VSGEVERVGPYDSLDEAKQEADRRNSKPRDWGWSHWWANQQPSDVIHVMRVRLVGPNDVVDPAVFENAVCELTVAYGDIPGPVRIVGAELDGECPDTFLTIWLADERWPEQRFGRRRRIWPAEFANPQIEAAQWTEYLGEDWSRWKPPPEGSSEEVVWR